MPPKKAQAPLEARESPDPADNTPEPVTTEFIVNLLHQFNTRFAEQDALLRQMQEELQQLRRGSTTSRTESPALPLPPPSVNRLFLDPAPPAAPITPDTNSPAPAFTSPEPKLLTSPKFTGKPSEYQNFMAQCELAMILSPHAFPNQETKVLFIIGHLRGDALTYTRDIISDPDHPLRHDFFAFKSDLDNVYLDRNYINQCATRLANLKQTKSAASYAVQFKSLVAPLSYNQTGKIFQYYTNLNRRVKEAIAIQGRATTFEALVDQSI